MHCESADDVQRCAHDIGEDSFGSREGPTRSRESVAMEQSSFASAHEPSRSVPRSLQRPPAAPLAPDVQQRHLRRLQRWRETIDREGYITMLSVVPPFGLIVRRRELPDRWLALSPNRSLAIFEQEENGHAECRYHLVEALGCTSDATSAIVALDTVRQHLGQD
jgi:hypothetical protein